MVTREEKIKDKNLPFFLFCQNNIHLFIIILSFTLYLFTVAPSIYWRDSPEFATTAYALDIAHSPGSPTYSLIGKIFTFIPIGSIAFRISLMSVFFGSITVGLIYQIIINILQKKERLIIWSIAIITSILFAISKSFWEWTNVQEVYSMQDFFFTFILLSLLRFSSFYLNKILCLSFILGLSLGVHITMILFIPSYFLYLFFIDKKKVTIKTTSLILLFFLFGFSVFLYLPLRANVNLPLDIGHPNTLSRMFHHMFFARDKAASFSFPLSKMPHQINLYISWIIEEFSIIFSILGILGLIILFKRDKKKFFLLFLLYLTNTLFFIRTWDAPFGFIPSFIVYTIFIAIGAFILIEYINYSLLKRVILFVFIGILFYNGIRHYKMNDKHNHYLAYNHGITLFNTLEEDSILFSANDNISFVSIYLQYIEKLRPDITHIHRSYFQNDFIIREKFPYLNWNDFNPKNVKDSILSFLQRSSNQYKFYWDFGGDEEKRININQLLPYGIVFSLYPEEVEITKEIIEEQENTILNFKYIIKEISKYDWSARDNYERIFDILGEFYEKRGYYEEAIKNFNEALKLNPNSAITYTNIGSVYMNMKKRDEGKKFFKKAIEIDPYFVPAYNNLAISLIQDNNFIEAEKLLKKSLYIEKNQPDITFYLSQLYLQKEDYLNAKKLLLILKKDNNYRLFAIENLGKIYFLEKNWEKALEEFKLIPENERNKEIEKLIELSLKNKGKI